MAVKTIKQYLEQMVREYSNLSNEFDNYSPKSERYLGYAKMCEEILHDLSDETLEQPVAFRKLNYCGQCSRYNNFHHCCRDNLGNIIKHMIFRNTEACICFDPPLSCGERREDLP